jgi:Amidohydrolase family.
MPHHMLMPGLVDAHAYTYMLAIGRRGATEDFRPSAEALYWSALLAYTTMLLSGVTTVRDSAHDPSVLERAAKRSGMRVIASRIAGPGERPGADWPELTLRAARDPGAAGTAPSGPGTRVALDASDAEIPPGRGRREVPRGLRRRQLVAAPRGGQGTRGGGDRNSDHAITGPQGAGGPAGS